MFGFKRRRRQRLRRTPLSDEQRSVLASQLPLFGKLAAADRRELEGLVQVFLAEKRFEGCGGLEVTDEMRLVIAAQACLLLQGRHVEDVYPGLYSILVYPHAYVAHEVQMEGGIPIERSSVRLGQSWSQGSLVIAWDHAHREPGQRGDGHNVVLHEFTHQLDLQDGVVDGAPQLVKLARLLLRNPLWTNRALASLRRAIEIDAQSTTIHYRIGRTRCVCVPLGRSAR